MTLTASEVSSLADTLTKWEYAEYFFTALVALACFGEYVATFTHWFTGGDTERKERLEQLSTLILIGALAFELMCLVKTNSLSGRLIGSLADRSEVAASKADKAVVDSNTAGRASENALRDATSAIGVAREAQGEVGLLKRDLASAKKQAKELADLLALRSINGAQQADLGKKLKAFSGAVEIVARGSTYDTMGVMYGIEGAFVQAEWRVREVTPPATSGNTFLGIMVSTVAGADSSTIGGADLLVKELRQLKIFAYRDFTSFPRGQPVQVITLNGPREWRWDPSTTATMRVVVGEKPPFPLKF